ncbi:MAG: hypothetical protein ACR5K9_05030 [Wolbachia sp.]
MFSGTNRDNAVEAGKISNQTDDSGVGLVASYTWSAIYRLLTSYKYELYTPKFVQLFMSLRDRIDEMAEKNPSIESLAIMKFCRSIMEKDDALHKKLKGLDSFAKNFGTPGYESDEELHSQLGKVITDFKLQNLQDKVGFLGLLKEKTDFTTILSSFRKSSRWRVYSLITDEGFKRGYIYTALDEEEKSFNESFKKSMNDYIKLAEEGKNVAGKCFEKGIDFQAYCEEAGNDDKTLNVNLVDYNGGEPIKISDILQQEGNIGELNIYCNRKHDICARREDKKRYYEFKEGACYQMTSTWPIKDKSGKVVLTCIMVMNVGSDGITEILKFNGKEFKGGDYTLLSEEDMELIKRNEELYIQGSPLCETVGKFLEMQHNREDVTRIEKDEKRDSTSLLDVVPGGNVIPTTSTANEGLSVHTGASSCDAAVQTETTMKQMENLESENRRLREESTEYNQFIEARLQEANKKCSALEKENQALSNRLKGLSVKKKESGRRTKKLGARDYEILSTLLEQLKEKRLSIRDKKECINRSFDFTDDVESAISKGMQLREYHEMSKLCTQVITCVRHMQDFILPDDDGYVTDGDLSSPSNSPNRTRGTVRTREQ